MRFLCILLASAFLLACGEVKQYETVSRPTNETLTANVGSELFRVDKSRDLTNAFGKADVFGGKVSEGYSELRYMGIAEDGQLIFRLTDSDVRSNETTMSRYGRPSATVNTTTTANVQQTGPRSAAGTANSRSTITTTSPPKATIQQLPPNTIEFIFQPSERYIRLDLVTVEVIEATPYSIRYRLTGN